MAIFSKPSDKSPLRIKFFGVKPPDEKYLKDRMAVAKIAAETEFSSDLIGPDNLPPVSNVEIISVFVDGILDEKVLGQFPNLKCIAVRSTGYDNIDLSATAKRGVKVLNVPAYGESTVAEFTFGLILALSRKICLASKQVKETGSFNVTNLQGFDLKDKTLGVIGTGRIGRRVIHMAKGFEMKVIAYDVSPDNKFAKEEGFEYLPLDSLLAKSDIVTLHVPYIKETHH